MKLFFSLTRPRFISWY